MSLVYFGYFLFDAWSSIWEAVLHHQMLTWIHLRTDLPDQGRFEEKSLCHGFCEAFWDEHEQAEGQGAGHVSYQLR
jgi:hypothetical protein